jgi:hypothetical protein
VPRAYEKRRGLRRQNNDRKGPSYAKNKGKGAYDGQNEGHGPLKMFFARKYLKVPRAYESLNPPLLAYFVPEMSVLIFAVCDLSRT